MGGDRFPRIPTTHLSDCEAPERRFRLLAGVRRELRARRYSVKTKRAYLLWIRSYVLFHERRHPRELDVRVVSTYLSHLATVERVRRRRRTRHWPRCASCAALMYGGGLRVAECVTLRLKDVDLNRREIVVRGGNGGKDCRTPLAESIVRPLSDWLRGQRPRFAADLRAQICTDGLAESLERKYPSASAEWR